MFQDLKESKPAIIFLEDDTVFKKDIFEENVLSKPFIEEKEKYKIIFTKNLKSVNDENLLFTNFIKSSQKKEFVTLKFLYDNLEDVERNINKYFKINEMQKTNLPKIERLKKIFYISTRKTLRNITKLIKCNYKVQQGQNYVPLRIFVKERENKMYIYLIDPHHLAWTATDRYGKDDPKRIYNHCKNFSLCITEIIK